MREDSAASACDQPGASDSGRVSRHAAGTARLLPAVVFGLGTAVLAGVIVGAAPAPGVTAHQVAVTASLGGAISELTGNPDTTCCKS